MAAAGYCCSMAQNDALTAEKIRHYEDSDGAYVAHIRVDNAGGWVGDFWVTFKQRKAGEYQADEHTIWRGGNGAYYDEPAPIWAVQEVAEEMTSDVFGIEFGAVEGPDAER